MAKEKSRGLGNEDDANNQTNPAIRTNHLLVIGIDKYSNGIPPLSNAVRDAQSFRDLMIKKYQFDRQHVVELYDGEATKSRITEVFDKLLQKLTDRDNLIVYFSGHGEFHELTKRGYWIPVEAKLGDRSSYLNNTEVTDFFTHLKAHHVLAIVDSCFSEALFHRSTGTEDYAAQKFENFPSRWLITAGRLEPVQDGFAGKGSPFATTLLSYFQNSTDQMIWTSDLCNHVAKFVPFNANQTPRGEPLPNVGHQGGQFIFRVKGYVEPAKPALDKNLPTSPDRSARLPKPDQPQKEPVEKVKDLDSWRDHLKDLLIESMDDAMIRLNGNLNRASRKYNDFILLRARFNAAKNDNARGVSSSSQFNLVINQVRSALLEMIDSIKPDDLKTLN